MLHDMQAEPNRHPLHRIPNYRRRTRMTLGEVGLRTGVTDRADRQDPLAIPLDLDPPPESVRH